MELNTFEPDSKVMKEFRQSISPAGCSPVLVEGAYKVLGGSIQQIAFLVFSHDRIKNNLCSDDYKTKIDTHL